MISYPVMKSQALFVNIVQLTNDFDAIFEVEINVIFNISFKFFETSPSGLQVQRVQ